MNKYGKFLFASLGLFLMISCNDGDDNEDNLEPTACFEASPEDPQVGDNIQFTNCSENATAYSWNFGDGNTSTQSEPTHSYTQQGTYEVTLLAGADTNDDGTLDELDEPSSISMEIEVAPKHKSFEFTIRDVTVWTMENPVFRPVANATVKLFSSIEAADSDTPDLTLTSDSEGVIAYYDMEEGEYYVLVEKDGLSNIVDGYRVLGVFETQEEIDNSVHQPNAEVGDLKFADLNGDGILDSNDQAPAAYFSVSDEETVTLDIFIGE